jgi:hypothetical protein
MTTVKTPPDPTKFGGAAKARAQKRKRREADELANERNEIYKKRFGADPDFDSEVALAALAEIEEELENKRSDKSDKPDKESKKGDKEDKSGDKDDGSDSKKDPKARKAVDGLEDRVAVVEAGVGALVRHAEDPAGRLGKPAKLDLKEDLKKGNLPKGVSVKDAAKLLRDM